MTKLGGALRLPQIATPAAPPTGFSALFPSSTGVPSWRDAAGTRTIVTAPADLPDLAGVYAPSSPPPVFPAASAVISTFQSGHGWTSSGTGGTFNLNDTADFDSGLQSAKMTTGDNGLQCNIRKFAGTIPDTTGRAVRLRIKVDSTTNLSELDFYLGTSSLGNNYKWSFFVAGGDRFIPEGEWCTITLNFASAAITGSPTRSGLTDAQLQAWDDNAGSVVVHIQSVELIPDGSSEWPTGVVSICFDDAWSSPATVGATPAWSKLDQLGWPATLFLITEAVGSDGSHITLDDIKKRHDRWGWEVAGHSHTSANHTSSYTGITAAALDTDRRAQKAWLLANGFRDYDGSAYPLGQWGKTSDAAVTRDYSRRYFAYERTTHSRTMETWPPCDPMRLRAYSSISTFAGATTTPTQLTTGGTGLIAKAAANAGWLILIFHKISSGSPASTSEIAIADFISIMDTIVTAGMDVATVGAVLTRRSLVGG